MTMVLALGPVAYQVRIPCRITPHRWKPCLLLTDTVYGLARRITAMATSTGFMIYPKENGVLPAGEIHTITIYVIRLNWQLYNHSASYLYDYGDDSRPTTELPSKDVLSNYAIQMSTLFDNTGQVWSGTKEKNFVTTYSYYDISLSSWNRDLPTFNIRHRVQLESL